MFLHYNFLWKESLTCGSKLYEYQQQQKTKKPQSPLTMTSHNDLSQSPLTMTSHNHLSQWPLTITSHNHLSQSPLTSNNWTEKKTMTYDVGNPSPGLRQAHKCGGVKSVSSPLHNWNSLGNAKKPERFHSKRPHTITKNEWQHKNEQYNSRDSECSLLNGC